MAAKHQQAKAKLLQLTWYQHDLLTVPWRNASGALTQTLLKARRIGGSTAAALLGISWCLGREMQPHEPGQSWAWHQTKPFDVYVISKDFQSSKDILREVAEICAGQAGVVDEDGKHDTGYDIDPQATVVRFPTGCAMYALACSPSACRGKTGGVIADELPFWRRQEDMWAAVNPISKPNLGNSGGYPRLLLGTPWDSGSLAHRLFTDGGISAEDFRSGKTIPLGGYPFIRHRVDIYDAVRDGFPINPEQAFAELGIPELIETEYKCIWRGESDSFFPLDKLRHAHEDEIPDGWEDWDAFFGIDCGGARGRDNTSVVQWRRPQDSDDLWMAGIRAWNKAPEGTEEKLTWQADQISDWVLASTSAEANITLSVDRGIMGADIIDFVRKRLKGQRRRLTITGVGMDPRDQERYAKAARRALERNQWRLYTGTEAGGDPNGARVLGLELNSLKTRPGDGGRLIFVTPRDLTQRHRDRAWAALIGLSKACKAVNSGETAASNLGQHTEPGYGHAEPNGGPTNVMRYYSVLDGC